MIVKPATKESAIHCAKYLVLQEAENPQLSIMKRMALKTSVATGGVDELITKLYDLGFVVAADMNNPFTSSLFETGALIEKK